MKDNFYNQLKEICSGQILIDEPMKNYTTFRIGGAADYFVLPKTIDDIKEIVILCKKENVPFYIIGNGSNLLVGDKGFRGVIIQIYKALDDVVIEKQDEETYRIVAGAGVMLSKLSRDICNQSLKGFEFASGIPGTLGGAVTMNAGAYGGEIKDSIVNAVVLSESGDIIKLNKDELALGYRTSAVQTHNYVVLESTFEFKIGNKEEILALVKELTDKRREKQPLEYPSAGSAFKRPEGYFAGKLIMDSGLRGYRVGDIMVSEKHCGFVVNVGNGTAKDVRKLIEDVDRIVYEKFFVHLVPEVRMIGEF